MRTRRALAARCVIALGAVGGWVGCASSGGRPPAPAAAPMSAPAAAENSSARYVSPLAIAALRERDYTGGKVEIGRELDVVDAQNAQAGVGRTVIAYPSDTLRITGVMTVPPGDGPFPVLLLNHGDIPREQYRTGDGTEDAAAFLTRAGYLTLASDYRGYGGSEDGVLDPRLIHHRPEFAIDVLNLLASVHTVPKADPQRIGLWGHSLGGEMALRVLEADRNRLIKAAVLWAPASADVNENNAFYTPEETPPLPPEINRALSPLYHTGFVAAPVQLHQGEADTEVKPVWAAQIRDALAEAGKPVELFSYPGEGHNFRAGGWEEIVPRTVGHFDRYVKGAAA